ncbi:hypothetical protein [Natribacillus halophilus]|uniref:DoxX-like family protein n=1 Tax=Natribacillus halophilus TaxID=549003 RepID=A0A1G8QRF2_9BACI|nr:hypothetical protein [Natribacillus halophilus]SDJ07258.1 hypothetical protein SAMN04488123_11360 [Natribacillus halophilus]
MGTVSVTGALLIITGWFALLEYDKFNDEEKREILQGIKKSPAKIILIALMPVGILVNIIGGFIASPTTMLVGASMIFLQAIIVSLLFWNRTRWKSILLLVIVLVLGIFIYVPLWI